MKIKGLLAGAVALGLGAAACGGGGIEIEGGQIELVNPGTLTVCTDTPFPPMEFEDPDAPTGFSGFDIELSEAIAADLGLETAVVTPGWDAITSGLAMEAGDCDISVSSITITEEREENVDFSNPYFTADQSLLVNASDGPGGIDEVTALAVQTGTTGEIWANENASDVEIISFEGAGDLYLALEAGEVDGVITDLVGNQGYVDENPDLATVVETFPTDEEYGMAVQEEGSENLLLAVNDSLATLQENGEYQTLFDSYFSG